MGAKRSFTWQNSLAQSIESLRHSVQRYMLEKQHRRLVRLYDFPARSTFLDASCGSGDCLTVVHTHFPLLEIHGIDISEPAISRARAKYPWAQLSVSDARSLPYSRETFDVVLSCMSLHHYRRPSEVFSDIARVLKQGGKLYVSDVVPRNRFIQRLFNFDGCTEPYHFERYYTRDEIERLAQNAGLTCTAVRSSSWLSSMKILVFQKPRREHS